MKENSFQKRKKTLAALTECSVMIALSAVLSLIKVIDLPYGGSVTACSMLPIVIAVYRHGKIFGIGVAFVNALIQMLLGMNTLLSYAVNWKAALAIILLDYILAFAVFALAPVLKKHISAQNVAMTVGVVIASVLRYVCHVIAGATVWAGISIPTRAALIYSLSYNASYMIPETIILALGTFYIFSVLDFSQKTPKRIEIKAEEKASATMYLCAVAVLFAGIIADTVLIFSKLQSESGEMYWGGFQEINYAALAVVTLLTVAVTILLVATAKSKAKPGATDN